MHRYPAARLIEVWHASRIMHFVAREKMPISSTRSCTHYAKKLLKNSVNVYRLSKQNLLTR